MQSKLIYSLAVLGWILVKMGLGKFTADLPACARPALRQAGAQRRKEMQVKYRFKCRLKGGVKIAGLPADLSAETSVKAEAGEGMCVDSEGGSKCRLKCRLKDRFKCRSKDRLKCRSKGRLKFRLKARSGIRPFNENRSVRSSDLIDLHLNQCVPFGRLVDGRKAR